MAKHFLLCCFLHFKEYYIPQITNAISMVSFTYLLYYYFVLKLVIGCFKYTCCLIISVYFLLILLSISINFFAIILDPD